MLGHLTRASWAQVRQPDLEAALIQSTIDAAVGSRRLRAHARLPVIDDDWSRTLIAMTSQSYVPPHFHPSPGGDAGSAGTRSAVSGEQSAPASRPCERLVSLRGRCAALLFDADGGFEVVYLAPSDSDDVLICNGRRGNSRPASQSPYVVKGIEITTGIAHSLIAIDDLAVICEYQVVAQPSLAKVFLPNFPSEGDVTVPEVLRGWRQVVEAPPARPA